MLYLAKQSNIHIKYQNQRLNTFFPAQLDFQKIPIESLPVYSYIAVSISPAVFMQKTNCVSQFMDDNVFLKI